MNAPALSIIVPTYNRAAFLGRALESAVRQSWTDFELIVVNDASTDETAALLADLQTREPRLRVIQHQHGRHGPAAARNLGLAQARGTWVAFLDSDDEWEADKLASFMAATAEDVVFVGSNYHIVEGHDKPAQTMWGFLETVMFPWWRNDALSRIIPVDTLQAQPARLAERDIMRAMTIGGFLWPQTSSVMVRRDAVEAAGRFDERLARTEDMDLWLNLMDHGRFVYLERPLARYHIEGRANANGARYDTHAAGRRHDAYREMKAHLRLLKSLPRRFPLSPDARAILGQRIRAYHTYCAKAAEKKHPLLARWHHWRARPERAP